MPPSIWQATWLIGLAMMIAGRDPQPPPGYAQQPETFTMGTHSTWVSSEIAGLTIRTTTGLSVTVPPCETGIPYVQGDERGNAVSGCVVDGKMVVGRQWVK